MGFLDFFKDVKEKMERPGGYMYDRKIPKIGINPGLESSRVRLQWPGQQKAPEAVNGDARWKRLNEPGICGASPGSWAPGPGRDKAIKKEQDDYNSYRQAGGKEVVDYLERKREVPHPVAASMPVPVSAVPAVAKVGSGFIDDLKVIASRKYAPNLLGRGVSYGYIRKHGASQAGAGLFSQSQHFLDRVAATKEKMKDTGSDAYKSWEEAGKKMKGKFVDKMREIQARPGYKPPPPGVLKITPAPAQAPAAAPTGSGIGWDWKRGITY